MNTCVRGRDVMCSVSRAPMTTSFLSLRRHEKRAFTLVELLVVIGIIAVLVSILLPTLRSVRRQANLVQCSSNMKQLSMSMLMYIQDNKGRFPAAEFFPIAGAYPYGWGWANELVAQNYIKAPGLSVYKFPGDTAKKFNRSNVFRCPEGIDEDSGFNGQAGDYPTDPRNNAPRVTQDSGCQARGFGIASWYQLNCRNTSASNAVAASTFDPAIPGKGARITPFMGFQSGSTNNMALIKDAPWQRNLSMVKRGAELLMIVEASDQNWYNQADPSGKNNWLPRLGARHGKKTADGLNAWTNMAFFDGHVGLYESKNFENPKDQMDNQVRDVIFYVNKQKGFK